MAEVATRTAYTGGKMDTDGTALHRISTVDEDEAHLERFWEESRADLCQELIGLVTFEGMERDFAHQLPEPTVRPSVQVPAASTGTDQPGIGGTTIVRPPVTYHYEVRLDVSKSFDSALLPSMELSLFSFFVHNIAAKWFVYTNKGEAGDYADKASTLIDDVHRKAVYKKKPTRPTYDD